MTKPTPSTSPASASNLQSSTQYHTRITLSAIMLLFAVLSMVGMTWGLPSRANDAHLFGADEPWSGEKIYRLAEVGDKFAPGVGADVDVDASTNLATGPVELTETPRDVARIYLRYRLFTHQPDEMITMMALAGMQPAEFNFDPRLYQYGGLFIYPVGAMIRAGGLLGLIDVRSDVAHYLDHPEEFGKFYIVARAYAAIWGLLGVLVVYAIGRRFGGAGAGLLAALLFTILPVVLCMSHEGKPHLPGAVLMLMAVLFAMRYLEGVRGQCANNRLREFKTDEDPRGLKPAARDGANDWWMMCVCCGAALGMVLSSLPIFVLIPAVAWLGLRSVRATVGGLAVAAAVYMMTNPYIVINALTNREVLASNFGNSLAMYQVAQLGQGFVRVIELTFEGATQWVTILGIVAIVGACIRRNKQITPIALAAGIFTMQFVLIGAGKPAEYGRFGIFTDTVLAIGTACLLWRGVQRLPRKIGWLPVLLVAILTASYGWSYLRNFHVDSGANDSRHRLADQLATDIQRAEESGQRLTIALLNDPAPYGCPPINFATTRVVRYASQQDFDELARGERTVLVKPVDQSDRPGWPPWRKETPISWANKPFTLNAAPTSQD